MGVLVGAVEDGDALAAPLAVVGVVFVAHAGAGAAAHPGVGQPRRPHRGVALRPADAAPASSRPAWATSRTPTLAGDLTVARDFDLGMTGPPLSISHGLHRRRAGADGDAGWPRRPCSSGFAWWAPLVLGGAWLATHWLLRESGVWKDRNTDEVREAQRARRLRLPPGGRPARGQGAAALRARRAGCSTASSPGGSSCSSCSTRRPGCGSGPWLEPAAGGRRPTSSCSGRWRDAAADGRLALDQVVTFAQAAVGRQRDRLRRAQLGARRRRRARGRGAAARAGDGRRPGRCRRAAGAAGPGRRPTGCRRRRSRFRDVTFAYPTSGPGRCSTGFDLTIPAGTSLAIVGQNGAGKTTLAKLLCRLYDPQSGAVEVDGVDLRELDLDGLAPPGHRGVPGLRPLRAAAARQRGARPAAPDDASVGAALRRGGGGEPGRPRHLAGPGLRGRHRPLRRAVAAGRPGPGAVRRRQGAGVVLLDEPTAQLDVRGEAEIFDRILAATRGAHDDPRSRTGSRPCATPTASACSRRAGWSSWARTTS